MSQHLYGTFFGFVNLDEFDGHWTTSPKTLVHAFVTARVDYCNMMLAHWGLWQTDCKVYWTRWHVSSSMTVNCRRFCMLTCTGSMWQIWFGTS